MKPPCFKDGEDCPNRWPGCHEGCEEYKRYRQFRDLINDRRAEENSLISGKIEQVTRTTRRLNIKKR